jgi:hypothetical protein
LLYNLKFWTRPLVLTDELNTSCESVSGEPDVARLKPNTALVAVPPLITPVVLLVKGEGDIEVPTEASAVEAVTVIEEVLGEVNVGVVIPTAMVDVPVLWKLNPEAVKLANPLTKCVGALFGPKSVGLVVVTVMALLMSKSLLLLTSVASKIGCVPSAMYAKVAAEGC